VQDTAQVDLVDRTAHPQLRAGNLQLDDAVVRRRLRCRGGRHDRRGYRDDLGLRRHLRRSLEQHVGVDAFAQRDRRHGRVGLQALPNQLFLDRPVVLSPTPFPRLPLTLHGVHHRRELTPA